MRKDWFTITTLAIVETCSHAISHFHFCCVFDQWQFNADTKVWKFDNTPESVNDPNQLKLLKNFVGDTSATSKVDILTGDDDRTMFRFQTEKKLKPGLPAGQIFVVH